MGSSGVGRQSVRANLLSLHYKWTMASIGSLSLASTVVIIVLFHKLGLLILHHGQVHVFKVIYISLVFILNSDISFWGSEPLSKGLPIPLWQVAIV